jgi:hypothetical protein
MNCKVCGGTYGVRMNDNGPECRFCGFEARQRRPRKFALSFYEFRKLLPANARLKTAQRLFEEWKGSKYTNPALFVSSKGKEIHL